MPYRDSAPTTPVDRRRPPTRQFKDADDVDMDKTLLVAHLWVNIYQ